MKKYLSTKALRFEKVLRDHGVPGDILEFETPARTAQLAADAISCELNQIVKSLIFRVENSGNAILILTAGGNRVSEDIIEELIHCRIGKADANFVREQTGYAIGGVPPFGHLSEIETIIDEDLLRFEEVWAAGGTPNTVFPIDPNKLCVITKGKQAKVSN